VAAAVADKETKSFRQHKKNEEKKHEVRQMLAMSLWRALCAVSSSKNSSQSIRVLPIVPKAGNINLTILSLKENTKHTNHANSIRTMFCKSK